MLIGKGQYPKPYLNLYYKKGRIFFVVNIQYEYLTKVITFHLSYHRNYTVLKRGLINVGL